MEQTKTVQELLQEIVKSTSEWRLLPDAARDVPRFIEMTGPIIGTLTKVCQLQQEQLYELEQKVLRLS